MQKIKREYKLSPIEFYRFQLNNIINGGLPTLSQTDITILAYIYIHGIDSQHLLLTDRIFTHPKSVTNAISSLIQRGYIIKTQIEKGRNTLTLNPNIKLLSEDFIQISIVTLDPNSEEVYHKYYRK